MAVVRFSDEFKSSIIRNAEGLFSERRHALEKNPPKFGDELADIVYKDILTKLDGIEREWFNWKHEFNIERIGEKRYYFTFTTTSDYPSPNNGEIVTPDGVTIDSGYRTDLNLPDTDKFAPFKQQIDDWVAAKDALDKQCKDFVGGVKKVIDAHATLAPALKAWPPLWDLVSEEYRERHRKVVERTKATETEIDVDLDKLTSAVAAHKILHRK